MNHLKIKEIGGLTVETIIRLSRFIMQNNYFSYDEQYYHQICGGAMGSPLRLPPLFSRFSDLKDGKADRIEIFTTDRTPKMIRHVFEEKIL